MPIAAIPPIVPPTIAPTGAPDPAPFPRFVVDNGADDVEVEDAIDMLKIDEREVDTTTVEEDAGAGSCVLVLMLLNDVPERPTTNLGNNICVGNPLNVQEIPKSLELGIELTHLSSVTEFGYE
jgi:hypothetical protein